MPARQVKRSTGPPGDTRVVQDILGQCKASKIELIRFLYCGNDGVIRGKACHARFLASYLRSGIGLTVAMQSFNMTPAGI